jgi:hypothetical protein
MFNKNDISQILQNTEFTPPSFMWESNELMFRADENTYYTLLCMIYRATPTTIIPTYDPGLECIKAARAALDCHSNSAALFKDRTEMWESYLHW